MRYAVEVQGLGAKGWTQHRVTFASRPDAQRYARVLATRWKTTHRSRVVEHADIEAEVMAHA